MVRCHESAVGGWGGALGDRSCARAGGVQMKGVAECDKSATVTMLQCRDPTKGNVAKSARQFFKAFNVAPLVPAWA